MKRFRSKVDDLGGITKAAEITGISRPTLEYWYYGVRTPKAENLRTLSTTFDVTADWLLGLSPFPSVNEDMKTANLVTGLNDDCLKLLQGYSKKEPEHDLLNRLLLSPQFFSRFLPALVTAYFSSQLAIQAGIIAETTTISSPTIKDNLKKDLEEKKRDLRLTRFEFGEACMMLLDDLINTPDLINDIEKLIKSLDRKRVDAIMEEYGNGEH